MTTIQIVFLAVIFLAVAGIAFAVMRAFAPRPTQTRLKGIADEKTALEGQPASQWQQKIVNLAGPLAKLALPSGGWENSALRIRFMNAGYRGNEAPMIYFALKSMLTLALPGIFFLYAGVSHMEWKPNTLLLVLLMLAAFGYYLPNGVLARMITSRQRELFENFPDAMDLMTVCVEAGLGLDAAITRVGEEMRLKSEVLAEELHLVNLELRAGRTREQALRNLALRTGVEEIDALVAMLVQADRFGTSVADSLRVHAESLRSKRRLRAEEAAAKIPVKLLFPLIFFIFPSLLLVLLGPAFIGVYRVLLPTLAGQ